MLKLMVNGEERVLPADDLVSLLKDEGLDLEQKGFAVAINGAVVSRSDWARHVLQENDRVEIVAMYKGG